MDGPTALTLDSSDGSVWITSALTNEVLHVSSELEILGGFVAPFDTSDPRRPAGISGIAYHPERDTLFVVHTRRREVLEVDKEGAPLDSFTLQLPAPVNPLASPTPKGLTFDPTGDSGRGSLWLIGAVVTRVYEVALDGTILDAFCHPDDRDGCPGAGRSAPASDLNLLFEEGRPVALELIGGSTRKESIRRVDLNGEPVGIHYPLEEVGGRPGGFARAQTLDPQSGEQRDVFYVTNESDPELHVLEIVDPTLLPVHDVSCIVATRPGGPAGGSEVVLQWQNRDTYDAIAIHRDGELLGELGGVAESFVDASPPDGLSLYEIRTQKGTCEASFGCTALVGAGQVLRFREFDGTSAMDIARDNEGFLWITDDENQIVIYDRDLELQTVIPGPFQEEGDATSGIAYNPTDDTLFVYNTTTHRVAVLDRSGSLQSLPFPSGVSSGPEERIVVSSMLFDPSGNEGSGSLWYLNHTAGRLEERSQGGELLHSCFHPDEQEEPHPPESPLHTHAWGLTSLPGRAFDVLEVGGGRIREGRSTRFLRLDPRTCTPTGDEIPVEGLAAVANVQHFAFLRTELEGRSVAYAVSQHSVRRFLIEIDATAPPMPHPTDIRARQEGPEQNVTLTFLPQGNPATLSIRRDGVSVGVVPGDATSFLDVDVPTGIHRYEVVGQRGAERSDGRSVSLRVGVGSVAAQAFSAPPTNLHSLTYDPVQRRYLAASNRNLHSDELYIYDEQLAFSGRMPSPFPFPSQVGALTVRVSNGGSDSEIFCLGWKPGAGSNASDDFPMVVLDSSGNGLRTFTVTLPSPPGNAVTFPTGLAWDAKTDTLWYRERNSEMLLQSSLDGQPLRTIAHPLPPHQDEVFAFGLTFLPERETLLLSTSGRLDRSVTRLVEITRDGTLTGTEIPVGSPSHEIVGGFTPAPGGEHLLVAAATNNVWDLVLTRAFENGGSNADFLRGDVEENGEINITDAVSILGFLFLGNFETECRDALDVDDRGSVELTDALSLLNYLFQAGLPPARPFPEPGTDPTPDGLDCLRRAR